jgi:hypothetical protein
LHPPQPCFRTGFLMHLLGIRKKQKEDKGK